MSSPALPAASLKPLFITVALCVLVVVLYWFLGIEPHPFVATVVSIAPLIAAISWLRADARARRVQLVHDMGLFLWLAWPVLIPWYALKTHGRHALPLALLILFLILTPLLVALAIQATSALSGPAS